MSDQMPSIAVDRRAKEDALPGAAEPAWATVEKVPDLFAAHVLTPGHVAAQAVATLSPFLLFVASIAACVVTVAVFGPDVPPSVSAALFACCLLSFAAFMVLSQHFPGLLGGRYMRAVARRAFDSRPERWVDTRDPTAVFVDIIPRQNWHKRRSENAEDIGFLKIDRRAREITFEGDRERYRIGAESITSCDLESFGRSFRSYYFIVVLRANTAAGPWETYFWTRHVELWPRNTKRKLKIARDLQRRILEVTTR
jgi:hypothetical protein